MHPKGKAKVRSKGEKQEIQGEDPHEDRSRMCWRVAEIMAKCPQFPFVSWQGWAYLEHCTSQGQGRWT